MENGGSEDAKVRWRPLGGPLLLAGMLAIRGFVGRGLQHCRARRRAVSVERRRLRILRRFRVAEGRFTRTQHRAARTIFSPDHAI